MPPRLPGKEPSLSAPGRWSGCLPPSGAQDRGHLQGEGSLLLSGSREPRGGRWWASRGSSWGPLPPGSELSELLRPAQLMQTPASWALGQVREGRAQGSPGAGRRQGQEAGAGTWSCGSRDTASRGPSPAPDPLALSASLLPNTPAAQQGGGSGPTHPQAHLLPTRATRSRVWLTSIPSFCSCHRGEVTRQSEQAVPWLLQRRAAPPLAGSGQLHRPEVRPCTH